MDWIDIPIVEALDYFHRLGAYFLKAANYYGTFFGTLGLLWTGFRLVNARIGVKEMLWDTIYKWIIFIALINFYVPATNLIALVANEVGLKAGGGKELVVKNFAQLKKQIEDDLKLQREWSKGLVDLSQQYLGVSLSPINDDESVDEYLDKFSEVASATKWASKKQRKEFEAAVKNVAENYPMQKSAWGEGTLQALDSILIIKDPETGEPTKDLTNAYIDLNIWLRDKDGSETSYLSTAAIVRVGVLAGQIMIEKGKQKITNIDNGEEDSDSNGNPIRRIGDAISNTLSATINSLVTYALAWLCAIIVIASIVFASIQYIMTVLEYIIIQGIGAFFIPFYLFDGTKEIPKKLVPVFISFLIKILVMLICMMFIIYIWIDFAAKMAAPEAKGITFVTFVTVLFTGMLSFVLTSNAPKIAMTLLTGQPQLSMGEFVAAAATMAGGAMMARNAAGFATSPMTNAAKVKMGEAHQRHQASSAAREEAKTEYDAENRSKLTSQKPGKGASAEDRKAYNDLKKEYRENRNAAAKSAGQSASDAVRDQQKANYMNNGGALGTAGRMLAHYTGGFTHPVQTLKSGRNYQSPSGMHDFVDIAKIAEENSKNPPAQVTFDDEQNKTANVKNRKNLEDNLGVGTRNDA